MAAIVEKITDQDIQRLFSYPNIEFEMYETDDSPEDVAVWYHDKRSDWRLQQVYTGGLTPSVDRGLRDSRIDRH